jgi:hypothetical protein
MIPQHFALGCDPPNFAIFAIQRPVACLPFTFAPSGVSAPGARWLSLLLFVLLRARFMHQTLDSEIRECYLHAAECHRSADQSRDWAARQDFLEMAKRWLRLARNYEFAEQLSNFSKPVEKATNSKFA